MNVWINNQAHDVPADSTLADAINRLQPTGPFAAAVNLQFVPRVQYAQTPLHDGDRIEIIAPVTGG